MTTKTTRRPVEKVRLTKSLIDKVEYRPGKHPKSRDIRWDSVVPGFGLQVYPSGKKVFLIWYRVEGRQRFMTIGDYGVLTVKQARDEAMRQLAIASSGGDPLATRQSVAKGETVKHLAEAFMSDYVEAKTGKKPNGLKSKRDIKRRIEKLVIPAWGGIKCRALKRSDVVALHKKVGKRAPYEANRLLATIRRMFKLAERWGYVDEGHSNPAAGIEPFGEDERDRWVTPVEMPRLAKAINATPSEYVKAAVWLYLLTGLRKEELLAAKWSDVHFDREVLRVEDTKNGESIDQVLSPTAIAILKEVPRVEGNPYVFIGRRQGRHLVNINKPWGEIRRAAGVEDVRLHDLRRTVGSWLVQEGHSLELIGRVLNHKSIQTTKRYARFAQENVRTALTAHGMRLMEAATAKQEDDGDAAQKSAGA